MHGAPQRRFGRKFLRWSAYTALGTFLIVMPGLTAPPPVSPVTDEPATDPDHPSAPAKDPDHGTTGDEPGKTKGGATKPVSPLELWKQMIAGKTPVVPLGPSPVQPEPTPADAASPAPAVDPSEAPLPVIGENGDAGDNRPTLFVPPDQRLPTEAGTVPPRPPISQTATTAAAAVPDATADGETQAPREPVPVRFLETTVNGGLEATVHSNDRFTGASVSVVDPEVPQTFSGFEDTTAQSTHGWLSKGRLVLRLTTGIVFDDNVDLRAHHPRSDFILTLSPSITYVLGSSEGRFSMTANYTAVGLFFLKGTSKNSVDHSGNITAAYRFNELTVGSTFSVRSTDGGDRDAGDRVQQLVVYIGAFADCRLTEKISLDLNGDLSSSTFSHLLDAQEARVQLFLNFAVRPKVQLAGGFLFGTLAVDRGPTQTYEQVLARVALTPTAKLGFNGSFGVEVRQLGDGVADQVSPVFSIGTYYAPWENVAFNLDTRYRTYPSTALRGEDYQAFTLGLGVRRTNLLDRFMVSLTFGFEHDRYQQTIRETLADRRDNFFYTQVGAELPLKKYVSLSAFYEFSFNASSGSGSQQFNRNRVGIFFNLRF